MTASLLANVEMAPKDPILGVTETFVADTNPQKVNLGVGVYLDDAGKVPVLQAVRSAEQKLAETALPRNYLPIDGIAAYNKAVQSVVFGAENEAVKSGRIVTVQTLGWYWRSQGGRGLLAPPESQGRGLDQRSELGESPRAAGVRRVQGQQLRLL